MPPLRDRTVVAHPEQVMHATSAPKLQPSVRERVGGVERCLGQGDLREGRCPKDDGVGVTDDVAKAAGAGLLTSACVEDGSIFGGVDNGCFVREEVCPGRTALGLS